MNANTIHNASILIGIFLLTYSALQFSTARNLLKSGHIVSAVVTDLGAYQDSDGDMMYRPTLTFETENGDKVQWQQGYASNERRFARGEKVKMICDPRGVHEPRIFSFRDLFRNAIISATVGLPLLAVGLGYFMFQGYFDC